MHRIGTTMAVTIGLVLMALLWQASREDVSDPVGNELRSRVQPAVVVPVIRGGAEGVQRPVLLMAFYADREFEPAWFSKKSNLLPRVDPFVKALRGASRDGLRPEDYHLATIESLLSRWRKGAGQASIDQVVDLDLLLTDAFLLYGDHLLNGRVDPRKVYPDWFNFPTRGNDDRLILDALKSRDPARALERLQPVDPGYQRLRRGLMHYRRMAGQGGWPRIPGGPKLRMGDRDGRVPLLRKRLALSGDLGRNGAGGGSLFDGEVDRALRRFQERHGLTTDGVLGAATVGELNVPVEKRIRQIELNMERLRWLPGDLGGRYIFVNVADFRLEVVEKGQPVLGMRIIVGKDEEDQRTFVFAGKMTCLEINPYWNVPESIAVNEIIPKVQKNLHYLASQGIRIIDGWSENAGEVKPETIDWASLDPEKFRYRLRQDPGPKNPLGRIKFLFFNEFNIYLHDTPTRSLFQRERRTFSHGCIRIEKPIDLAAYLLRDDFGWTKETILAEIETRERKVVRLPEPVAVYIYYMTAWADPDGTMQFRRDVYRSDEVLEKALHERPLRRLRPLS